MFTATFGENLSYNFNIISLIIVIYAYISSNFSVFVAHVLLCMGLVQPAGDMAFKHVDSAWANIAHPCTAEYLDVLPPASSFIQLQASGDLSLAFTLQADVSLGDVEGSAWVVDARAEGLLNVTQVSAIGV